MFESIPGYDKWKTTPPDDHVDDDAVADGILEDCDDCPFCGEPDHDYDEDGSLYSRMFRIRCTDCGARGPWAPDLEMAVERWNRRQHNPPLKTMRVYPEGKE